MTAALAARPRSAGLRLSAEVGQLIVEGPPDLVDLWADWLRDRKADLLAELATEAGGIVPALDWEPPPLPRVVRCGTCHHFTPDTVNPAAGIGTCGTTPVRSVLAYDGGRFPATPHAGRICTGWETAAHHRPTIA